MTKAIDEEAMMQDIPKPPMVVYLSDKETGSIVGIKIKESWKDIIIRIISKYFYIQRKHLQRINWSKAKSSDYLFIQSNIELNIV